ncbi:MAG: phosphodiesterase [Planctomycetaceae bacterium]
MPGIVLQLTDLHLTADRHAALKGVRTRESLIDVLRFAKAQSQTGEGDFDYLVLTGDLAHDEQLATYEILRDLLGDWVSRCRLIPGNHDDRTLIRQVFPELVSSCGDVINFSVETAGWRLIGLDSHVDGEVYGRIDESQLQWLAAELTTHNAQPAILFLHHPPVPVHSAWLDRIGLQNADAFINVVRSFSQVSVICTGHVHQEFSVDLHGVQILTTPSTGVQFRPRREELVCDPIPPGFRRFRLADGGFESHVVRLPSLNHSPS